VGLTPESDEPTPAHVHRRPLLIAGAIVVAVVAVVAVTALGAFGSSDGHEDATIIDAGQLDIKLPPGYKVVHGQIAAPGATTAATSASTPPASNVPAGAGAPTTTGSATTIPLDNKEDPSKSLFVALGKFRACLDKAGVKFIGAPDQSNPDSPTNDPNYIKALSTCAAQSNIVQALQAAQSANENLTPAEIEQRNKGYLKWRSCMIDRGWKIPKPVPDSEGRLFNFGGGGGSGGSGGQSQIVAPPGKDLLSSKDLQDCATKAQKVAQAKTKG